MALMKKTRMLFFAAAIAPLLILFPPFVLGQDSPSLGDAARQARLQKQKDAQAEDSDKVAQGAEANSKPANSKPANSKSAPAPAAPWGAHWVSGEACFFRLYGRKSRALRRELASVKSPGRKEHCRLPRRAAALHISTEIAHMGSWRRKCTNPLFIETNTCRSCTR